MDLKNAVCILTTKSDQVVTWPLNLGPRNSRNAVLL